MDIARQNPMAIKDLSESQRENLRALRGDPKIGFSDEQKDILCEWFLEITESDLDTINKLLPNNTVATARQLDSKLYLLADMLTDAGEGGRLRNVMWVLQDLRFVEIKKETWPISKNDNTE